MGEIADDCYDRALDELENLDADPDYYVNRAMPWDWRRQHPADVRDDFDDIS